MYPYINELDQIHQLEDWHPSASRRKLDASVMTLPSIDENTEYEWYHNYCSLDDIHEIENEEYGGLTLLLVSFIFNGIQCALQSFKWI